MLKWLHSILFFNLSGCEAIGVSSSPWSATNSHTIGSVHSNRYGLWCPKRVSQAGISICIPQNSAGCNYTRFSICFVVFCCSLVLFVLPISFKGNSLALVTVKSGVKTLGINNSFKLDSLAAYYTTTTRQHTLIPRTHFMGITLYVVHNERTM